ncbi:MAG: VOC family protein [Pseudomonadota bacterium]
MAKDAAGVMAFIEEVFDAKPLSEPLFHANGDLWNAELEIGSSTILLGEASDGMALPGFVFVYVDDPDATHAKAIAQGAEPVMPIADQFYGHRDGGVKDPFGNLWWIGKKTEDVPFDELKRRAAEVDDHR